MTKLRQKVTFQVWYNKSRGSETISEPEINKNLDWYIVNNFLIKVDEVKSDGNTSKDNETSLSDFFHRLFPRFRHMQLDNSPKDGPSIKTTLSSYLLTMRNDHQIWSYKWISWQTCKQWVMTPIQKWEMNRNSNRSEIDKYNKSLP